MLARAGATSATIDPPLDQRLLATGARGGVRQPWSLGAGPFAAAGGIWSTFDDLVRFARFCARSPDCPPAWTRKGGADVVTGATRDAHACIIRSVADGTIVVVHSLRLGAAADELAITTIRQAVGQRS